MSDSLNDDPAVKHNSALPDDVAAFDKAATGTVKMIPISLIRKSDVALRDVQRDNVNYQTLLQSIRKKGVLNSILVREQKDGSGTLTYGLIDGLQRFSCASDAGQTEIPARIVNMDDAELLEAQIITNVNRIETKPAQYSEHLVRILARNPFMTRADLAEKICQSVQWLDERLSLTKLHKDIQKLVDESGINLSNAYALAKIPMEEQLTHVDAAIGEPYTTFVPRMKARVKEIREAKKSGKDASAAVFTPTAYLQKLNDVKVEAEKGSVRETILVKNGLTSVDAQKAWNLAIQWFLHLDEDSKAQQIAENEARKKKAEEKKEQMKIEREQKKAEREATIAASVEKGW